MDGMGRTIQFSARALLRGIATTGIVAALALAGGCSGSGNDASSTAASSSSTSRSASASSTSASASTSSSASDANASASASRGTPICASTDLTATLTQGDGGGAGSSYPYLVLTNSGTTDCSVTGYPGVSLASGSTQIGAAAERDDSVDVTTIVLKPGESAHSALRITNADNFDADSCNAKQADQLVVYPPDQTQALAIPTTDYKGCANADTVIITVRALEAGTGSQQ